MVEYKAVPLCNKLFSSAPGTKYTGAPGNILARRGIYWRTGEYTGAPRDTIMEKMENGFFFAICAGTVKESVRQNSKW